MTEQDRPFMPKSDNVFSTFEIRNNAIKQYISKAEGILHLGAHMGQERENYAQTGKPVLWVEAQPNIHLKLKQNISAYPDQKAFCALLGDKDGVQTQFYISNNSDGVSSSIFPFGNYGSGEKSLWPGLNLAMVDSMTLPMIRLDTLLSANDIDSAHYNFWVVDLQGSELLALNGATSSIENCDALYIEVSTVAVYTDGVLWPELRHWMDKIGFMPLWEPEALHDMVLFIRKQVCKSVASIFHSYNYIRHNQRRLEHLASLGLDLHSKHVLEVGVGIGDHTSFYLDRGCRVTAIEIRPENRTILETRFNGIKEISTISVDMDSPRALGQQFDVIHCYGLLYHLNNPTQALNFMAEHCSGLLLLETCVSYGTKEEINTISEDSCNYSQSFHGCGCRPTRPFIWNTLCELFDYVYMPRTQPAHEEFPLDWTIGDNNKQLRRSIFIASRFPIDNNLLADELLFHQESQ